MEERPPTTGIGLVEVSGLSLRDLGTAEGTVLARVLGEVLAGGPEGGEGVAAFANDPDYAGLS
ncbi:FXSXX-COOH protein [Nocardiopsis flavescens]|uniref:FXSXX-COOH protein n=1 Tax=Nocardiopsis flavescens TaxID=758803 RepID=A0A1M6SYF3_9ACTN|nr:FxSxx-COOH cyclophane-containing RiPP peptide [Nocardiopsis flavescens]SHK49690.1 FXSXX-COOH protein [Nocardiopsis flavescens]